MPDTAPPAADPALFDQLADQLDRHGPATAVEQLCRELRERGDYAGLFYALLMKKRLELGVSPIPTGPAAELPAHAHGAYEDVIRAAGRLVGGLFIEQGNLPRAWTYFRMLGEPDAMVAALENYQPGDEDDIEPVVSIAFFEGVLPRKGFDLVLQRAGICRSITLLHSHDLSRTPEVRAYCVAKLTRALYEQLQERLRTAVEEHEGKAPPTGATIGELIAGRDWLFADGLYHTDVSHLASVAQMAPYLSAGPELELMRQLCLYGRKLGPQLQQGGETPFEDLYRDTTVYLDVLEGRDVDAGVAHFRKKADEAMTEGIAYSAEVLVNLLLKIDRPAEALAVAQQYLMDVTDRPLHCPSIPELCQRANDYRALAEAARQKNDPVHFLAGLIAARPSGRLV